jgi:hypothetical protein
MAEGLDMPTEALARRGFVRAHTAAAWEQAYLPGNGWRGPMLRMGPLIDGDTDTQNFVKLLCARGWRGLRQESGQVFELALPASMEALQAQVSGSLWKNIAYQRRRLEKQGAVTAERHCLSAAQAVSPLQRAAVVEQASWVAQQGGEVKLMGARNQAYWSQLAEHGDGPKVVLWLLSWGERDIAFRCTSNTGRRCASWPTAMTRP